MKNLWYIAKKDLLQISRDRASLIFLLLVPLVLIIVIGFAFGNTFFGSGSSQITITVAVNNQDSGSVGKAIVDALHINTDQLKITVNQYSTPSQITDQVANNSNVNAGIVIPAGTTDKLLSASQSDTTPKNLVQFYSLPGTNDARITIVHNIVSQVLSAQLAGIAAAGQIYSVCNQPGNHCAQSGINAQTIATTVGQASAFGGPSTVQALTAGKAVKINTFDQLVPGYA
ncbi:MAG TPA: ABC transporter permease, partial [Ktedonobacteraceae bacterium]